MRKLLGAAVLICAVAGGVWALQGAQPASSPSVVRDQVPVGQEQPREGCLLENGFNVCDYGTATLKAAYLRHRDLLGEPLSGFDARCQLFRFNRLCFNPANPDGWQVEFANAGLQDLQVNGFTPQPGAELHPAVRDWLISQLEIGVDTTRLIGRVISPPVCDKATNRCRQWTDKALFLFPAEAVSASQVQRAPLGLSSVPRTASTEPTATKQLPLLVVGLALLVGLVLLLSARRPQQNATI